MFIKLELLQTTTSMIEEDIYFQTYGALPWFANFRLVAELSTPFVNLRYDFVSSVFMQIYFMIDNYYYICVQTF